MATHTSRTPPDAATTWRATWPVELVRQLAPLRRGTDPCQVHVGERTVWRTARTPDGPVVARMRQRTPNDVHCEAWGPGAEWFVRGLPQLLGADDEHDAFDAAGHDLLARLHRAHPWLRMPRTNLVLEALVSAVLEQRVTVQEALAARTWLIRRHGEAAPVVPAEMPHGMLLQPSAAVWREIPSWDWHRAGVDVHRASTVLRCALVAGRLEEIPAMDRTAGALRLRAVRGVGVWTAAETRQRALGDADAVSYGDTHLARFVGYALTGESADDERMEELLEPWRGHRQRVVRLLHLASGLGMVRTAPRIARARPRAHLHF